MHIVLHSRKNRYELEFSGKFNVITGNSGTRKTEFLKTLVKFKNNVKSIICNITINNYKLKKEQIFLFSNESSNTEIYRNLLGSVHNCIFIMDESCDVFHTRDIGGLLKKSDNYFILITREVMGWLPISIDSVYEFVNDNGVIKNRPRYCNWNMELTKLHENIEYILTEDSESSRLFFCHYFDVNVCTPELVWHGKRVSRDNAVLHIALEQDAKKYKHILVVFDAAAYGVFWPLLCQVIRNSKEADISVLAWDSFENYVLRCPRFGIELTKDDAGCAYNSLEQFSTHVLSKQLGGYSKSFLPSVLQNDLTFIQPPLDKLKKLQQVRRG